MDKKLTSAIIDRIIHHCHILHFTGSSYRIKNSTINSIQLIKIYNGFCFKFKWQNIINSLAKHTLSYILFLLRAFHLNSTIIRYLRKVLNIETTLVKKFKFHDNQIFTKSLLMQNMSRRYLNSTIIRYLQRESKAQ